MSSRLGVLVALVGLGSAAGLGLGALARFADRGRSGATEANASSAGLAANSSGSIAGENANAAADALGDAHAASGRSPLVVQPLEAPAEPGAEPALACRVRAAVRFPGTLPADDYPELTAFARRQLGKLGRAQAAHIARCARTAQPLEDSLPSFLISTTERVRDGAEVELALPCGAEETLLVLRSRYLALEPVSITANTNEPRVLEPTLGGCVLGRCTFPRECRPRDTTIELELSLEHVDPQLELIHRLTHPDETSSQREDRRSTPCDAAGRFELWGLAPRVRYTLEAHAPGFPPWAGELQVEPGQRLEFVVPLALGGTASGEVVDARGQPVVNARVSWSAAPESWNQVRTDEHGHFELHGIPKGETTLKVQRLVDSAESAPLTLTDGAVVRAVRMELASGRGSPSNAWLGR